MGHQDPKRVDYYWDEAARVLARAALAPTDQLRRELQLLAQRWERLALKAEAAEQAKKTMASHQPGNVTPFEVYRTADTLIRQYPKNAEIEASLRSRRAYESGDMYNFHHWARIARAVVELGRKSSRGRLVN